MFIQPTALTPSDCYSTSSQCTLLQFDEDELDTLGLHSRLIISSTRERLLSSRQRCRTPPPDTDADAVALQSGLSRLAPSVAKTFIPKSHVENTFTFRLINDVNFQAEEQSYIAMSYCCKGLTREVPQRVVTPVGDLPFGWTREVEQISLPTSSAMFQAVLHERQTGEGLWFDQVCINQEDDAERAMTIAASDAIYKNARSVVIVLDDIAATPDEEHLLRYYIEQYNDSESLHQQGMVPPVMRQYSAIFISFISRVVKSAYFDRAWCAYEMKLGQDHVFLVPSESAYGDRNQTIIRFTGAFIQPMLILASEFRSLEPAINTRIRGLHAFFAGQQGTGSLTVLQPDTPHVHISQRSSLVSTAAETFCMRAGGNSQLPAYLRILDANRDKMCIALNKSGLPLALAPTNSFSRPNIEDECLRSLLLLGLAARDPLCLCTTGTPLQLHDGSVSWLCRPTTLDTPEAKTSLPRFKKGANNIRQGSDGKAEYAQLDLVFLELPHRLQPNPLFPTHVARARSFVDLCIQYQIHGSLLWSFSRVPEHPRTPGLRNSFIQTLACIFDCGPRWLLEVSSMLLPPFCPTMEPYVAEMLFNPHLILETFLLLAKGQAAASTLLTLISTLIASGIPWASGASERTHGPLIVTAPTPPYSTYHTPMPMPMPLSKAIVFAPFQHSRTLLVAVPAAVKDAQYDPLARGWVLTSMNPFTGDPRPSVSWTLQSKGRVFGDGEFLVRLKSCGEGQVRNHRVYGPCEQ